MKYIFLDFDCVINNWYQMEGVSLENVKILKQIIDLTNASVIATTSNKYSFQQRGIDYYKSIFYKNYVIPLKELDIEIYDVTPFINSSKILEIKDYIESHKIEDYVILDDELIEDSELQKHQVLPDLYLGLQPHHVEPIINILNGNLVFYPPNYNLNETAEEQAIKINEYHNKYSKNTHK